MRRLPNFVLTEKNQDEEWTGAFIQRETAKAILLSIWDYKTKMWNDYWLPKSQIIIRDEVKHLKFESDGTLIESAPHKEIHVPLWLWDSKRIGGIK